MLNCTALVGSTVALLVACAGGQATEPPPAPPVPPPAVAAAPAPTSAEQSVSKPKPPAISKAAFGSVDGKEVSLYTLTNANGLMLKVTNYGTIITELHVPDRAGKLGDIVLGFENLEGYIKSSPYFGATVGRVANRIKNATFKLDGKTYKLSANNGHHTLHGGKKGWDKVVWDAEPSEGPDGPSIKFSYVSKDGEEGFPGTVHASTTYTLSNANELRVLMEATTDKTTIVNMAHHTYWNLGGYESGAITGEELTIHADKYTPGVIDPDGDPVPNGRVVPVKGTPFDFTVAKTIGKDLQEAGGKPIGYDHNWVVNGDPNTLRPVARLKDPKSGRVLTLEADQPGVQFYSGNFLDGSIKGKNAVYQQYYGLCLETQKFPNAINVPTWKDQVILKPGQAYKHSMVHHFTTE